MCKNVRLHCQHKLTVGVITEH